MKFEMDAIESEPGTPETTRIIFQGKLFSDLEPYHNSESDVGDAMLVEDTFVSNICCRRHLSPKSIKSIITKQWIKLTT